MANVYAIKAGNWSDPTIWNTGALPTAADNVYSNNFVVTIDYNSSYPNGYTVLSISNGSTTGVAAGGYFTPGNDSKITCTATIGGNGVVAPLYRFSLVGTDSATFVGSVVGKSQTQTSGAVLVAAGASGTLNFIGSVSSEGWYCRGMYIENSTATVNITGNVTGGTYSDPNMGLNISVNGPVKLNITGRVVGTTGFAISANNSPVVNITGSIVAGSTSAISFNNGSIAATGDITASSTANAISGAGGALLTSGPLISHSTGRQPLYVADWRWSQSTSPSYWDVYNSDLATKKPLYTPDAIPGVPAVNNVRNGTVYGTGSSLTGTCKVPAKQNVRLGVPVDDTTGTAVVNAADLWNQQTSTMTVAGSIGERLKNAATVQEVGSIWAAG